MKSYLKTFLTKETAGQFAKLAVIGVVNTVVYFALLNWFITVGIPRPLRTGLAFALATLVSYFLNRQWTFQIRHGWGSIPETLKFFLINTVALGVTVATVELGALALDGLTRLEENVANLVAAILILLPKFASYRDVVFRSALRREGRDPMQDSDAANDGPQPDPNSIPAHFAQGSD